MSITISQFSVEQFRFSARNLFTRIVPCFVKFLVSRQREGITISHAKFLFSESRKTLWGNRYVFLKNSGIETEKGYHDFPPESFFLTPKNLCRGTVLCSRKFLVSRQNGVSRFFVEKFLSHSIKKLCMGTVLCFMEFLVSKKVMDETVYHDWGITVFYRFCGLRVPKKL